MTSTFVFASFPLSLNFVGQFLEIKRSDKTGAKIIDSVRQKHSDFTAVLSGKIKHAWMRRVITNHTAGGKLLSQSLRDCQCLNTTSKYPVRVKIFEPLFSTNIINYLLHAQPEKGAAGPRRQLHKTLSFIENSLCFLRHFFIRLNSTRYRPNKFFVFPEGGTAAVNTRGNYQFIFRAELTQIEDVNRFKRNRTELIELTRGVIRSFCASENWTGIKDNCNAAMRTNV